MKGRPRRGFVKEVCCSWSALADTSEWWRTKRLYCVWFMHFVGDSFFFFVLGDIHY